MLWEAAAKQTGQETAKSALGHAVCSHSSLQGFCLGWAEDCSQAGSMQCSPQADAKPIQWEQNWEAPVRAESCFCVLALFSAWLCLGRGY